MKRQTASVIKSCIQVTRVKRRKVSKWSNDLARSVEPGAALETVNDLVKGRNPFPLALFESALRGEDVNAREVASRLSACGYSYTVYRDGDEFKYGMNPDADGITNVCTQEQAIHITHQAPNPVTKGMIDLSRIAFAVAPVSAVTAGE